jgi:hypothetical protein
LAGANSMKADPAEMWNRINECIGTIEFFNIQRTCPQEIMKAATASLDGGTVKNTAAWGAVFALSLGAFALVASEFMPVSLLTPIATDLHISEG